MATTGNSDDVLAESAAALRDGKSLDEVLTDLRSQGFGVIDSIKAVRRLRSCSLAEAKQIVHFSEAWKDMRETHDAFHGDLARKAEEDLS
ncbi:hypothetical protein ACTMUQ_03900 [Streptomyces sp. SD11]|uniref:hypothetical protein n=1 Tax=Streptomyces sp. SD11 TaxID=3452209 RepID=UPI003F89E376